ncbi:DNA mismatch repair protein MLH3 isoform X2 [Actinidia eriantha]|uniref:DNA mismatch repair protein MLH3 isoform X2 n=1 Tax=Actinidia eriantha TaxID=165200 RepID=UPI0025873B25|nr:DNA mismatch repair protein MLH3 isoform X2 [Actinidia eriantha]
MGDIKLLSEAVHSSVRSGVVLFDLTRVVEELIFNSVDAGATKISVAVGVGTCYIKVEDNGCGIARDGLVLLGQRYATSKFDQLAETDAVTGGFGFRGEALSSISDVSLLEVITKAHGRPNGYRKVVKGCKCLYLGIDDGRQDVGTTVIVRDLFYNQPVRRKHIQSRTKKVLQSVKKCVLRISLVHPKVLFKVVDIESDDELFCTVPSSSPLSLLTSGFGIEVSSFLHELSVTDGVLKLLGYMSTPHDTSSVKAFQYIYINSRYMCKGPIHKLLNELAVRFNSLDLQKANVGSQNVKPNKSQTHATYILNLCCPRSWYDITFEPSKTSVDFKDWFPVIGFFEKSIIRFWNEKSSYGELRSQGPDMLEVDNMPRKADNTSSPEDLPAKYESSKIRFMIHNEPASFGPPSPWLEMLTKECDLMSYQKYNRFTSHNASKFKEHQTGSGLVYENDYKFQSGDGLFAPSRVNTNRESGSYLQAPDNNIFSSEDHLLGNKLFAAEKPYDNRVDISDPNFKDDNLNADANMSNEHTRTESSFDCFETCNDVYKFSNDLEKPFLQHCSSLTRLPLDGESRMSSERFDFQIGGLRTKRKWLEPDDLVDVGEVDKHCSSSRRLPLDGESRMSSERFDFQIDVLRTKRKRLELDDLVDIGDVDGNDHRFGFLWKDQWQDKGASVLPSPRPMTKSEVPINLDFLSSDRVKSYAIGGDFLSREIDLSLDSVANIRHFSSSDELFGSEWCPMMSDPLSGTKYLGVEKFSDEDALGRCIKYDTNDRYDYMEDREIKDHISHCDDPMQNSASRETCSLSRWTNMYSDFKNYARSPEDSNRFLPEHTLDDIDSNRFLPEHTLDDILFPKYSEILSEETELLCLDSCGKRNGNCHAVTAHHISSSIYNDKDEKQKHKIIYQAKMFACKKMPRRRCHSAPPFYRGKKKIFSLNNHLTTAGKPKTHTIDDVPTSEESNELKYSQRPAGAYQAHTELKSMEDLLVYTRPDNKKAPAVSDDKKFKMENKSEDLHMYSMDSDIQDPLDSGLKWRKSCPRTANGDKLHNIYNEDAILDVSSGILHLAGDSLVPKSINKNCLEDAKVLLQVDKKFIPVVFSGVLAIIDQHAADERIRLEELRQKVLSGEKRTVTYLDTEQKLVLPEIEYQLLYNYAEQIQNWGWLCNIHAPGSRSFTKNLNLLHKQPTAITLIAVPCILGVNLTDVDLLEFLQQLADTDGSSTIPPSVHRILNFKACRGAIMFGDTLLPSECSLIVEELKKTSLCFQCAHGRPTTVPLVNLEALHKQIAKLGSWNGSSNGLWHGLRRHELSLERASHRLSSARGQC